MSHERRNSHSKVHNPFDLFTPLGKFVFFRCFMIAVYLKFVKEYKNSQSFSVHVLKTKCKLIRRWEVLVLSTRLSILNNCSQIKNYFTQLKEFLGQDSQIRLRLYLIMRRNIILFWS